MPIISPEEWMKICTCVLSSTADGVRADDSAWRDGYDYSLLRTDFIDVEVRWYVYSGLYGKCERIMAHGSGCEVSHSAIHPGKDHMPSSYVPRSPEFEHRLQLKLPWLRTSSGIS